MSTILPQSAANAQLTPMIVISTVHGLSITVPMDLIAGVNNARLSGDSPKTAAATPTRAA